jgi:hypothetical protein
MLSYCKISEMVSLFRAQYIIKRVGFLRQGLQFGGGGFSHFVFRELGYKYLNFKTYIDNWGLIQKLRLAEPNIAKTVLIWP